MKLQAAFKLSMDNIVSAIRLWLDLNCISKRGLAGVDINGLEVAEVNSVPRLIKDLKLYMCISALFAFTSHTIYAQHASELS